MRTRISFVVMSLALLAAVPGCESTRPFISDVNLARQVWVRSRPTAYRFEVASASSWFPKSGYTRVEVEDGVVVEATDPEGNPTENFTLTVDSLWGLLLAARERGELNSARFDRNGVPVKFDYGPWELDGGVGFWVRNFVRRR
jgi:hypothetical protein